MLLGTGTVAYAQNALGSFQSMKGLGLTYENSVGQNTFNNYTIYADMYGVLTGRTDQLGFKASFSRCNIFLSKDVRGTNIKLFAGPGVSLGYVKDFEKGNLKEIIPLSRNRGFTMGVTGSVGIRADLPRNLILDASLTMECGVHLRQNENGDGKVTSLYMNGLIRSAYPQIGLLYNFSGNSEGETESGRSIERHCNRFKFGIEWGYSCTFYSWTHFNYICSEGYRINNTSSEGCLISNGFILANFGVNATDRLCLSLSSGFVGVSRKNNVIPINIRATEAFKGNCNDGPLCFAEAGIAFPLSIGRKINQQLMLGGGWRFAQTNGISLDILGGLRIYHQNPYITDADTGSIVSEQNVRASDALFVSACFGVALNF